jgi:hypothetical protein
MKTGILLLRTVSCTGYHSRCAPAMLAGHPVSRHHTPQPCVEYASAAAACAAAPPWQPSAAFVAGAAPAFAPECRACHRIKQILPSYGWHCCRQPQLDAAATCSAGSMSDSVDTPVHGWLRPMAGQDRNATTTSDCLQGFGPRVKSSAGPAERRNAALDCPDCSGRCC